MTRRFPRRALLLLLLLPAFMLAYCAVAALWAWSSLDDLLARAPVSTATAVLTPPQTRILLAIEDPTFYAHHGLSLANGQGVATLSSGLARELFLNGDTLDGTRGAMQRFYRAFFACCKRIDFGRDAMSLVVDAKLSKPRQLALFAATVYMGTQAGVQVKGLDAAALAYFGTPLAALPDADFTALAAMIKAPNQYHPVKAPAAYAQRVARAAAVAAGRCHPDGWFDTTYAHCSP